MDAVGVGATPGIQTTEEETLPDYWRGESPQARGGGEPGVGRPRSGHCSQPAGIGWLSPSCQADTSDLGTAPSASASPHLLALGETSGDLSPKPYPIFSGEERLPFQTRPSPGPTLPVSPEGKGLSFEEEGPGWPQLLSS